MNTRGVDVNAKAEFYKQMSELTKQGKCIIMISSDMPELISMSDRILVVKKGQIEGELVGETDYRTGNHQKSIRGEQK